MATASNTWKQFERRAAAFFGAKRAVLSGNTSGRDDVDGGDSTHPRLYVECKLREKHTIYRVWDMAKRLAKRKAPVICLQEKGRPGFLVCVHSADFQVAVVEWLAVQSNEVMDEVTRDVWRAKGV